MLDFVKNFFRDMGGPEKRAEKNLETNRELFHSFINQALSKRINFSDSGPMPPAELVAATALLYKDDLQRRANENNYFSEGYVTALDILKSVTSAGLSINEISSVYELGCGTARLIRHMRNLPGAKLFASDVREATIEWCRTNISGVEFHNNELEPPLSFLSDNQIDLVVAQSVFTHIPLRWQRIWLSEIHRIMKDDGIFWCTVIGQHHIDIMLDNNLKTEMENRGEVELDSNSPKASYSTQLIGSWDIFQTEQRVREVFGEFFSIIEYRKKVSGLDTLVLKNNIKVSRSVCNDAHV